ncbi:MAG: histidine kinase [Rhodocyclaceae bacterium]|nr:histidine kinase [Rhodocyclaceae bacterium]MDZ4213245.1 histidine kinase [Rhodocyclaceae bacterium]
MRRFYPSLMSGLRDSVLLRAGLIMSLLALLSVTSIVISTVIAEDISGRANAVNVSGSLRFLTYRTLSEVLQPAKRAQAHETIKLFERRLLSLERFIDTKSKNDSPSLLAIHSVVQRWNTSIRSLEIAAANGSQDALLQLVHEVPNYVDQIDQVVRLIEEELESKARRLRITQLILLGLIVTISLGTLWVLRRQLIIPLAQLLQAARTVSQGSFSARVSHVGNDELGQLGSAFNTMVSEIASMYAHLEDKVKVKTQELMRTNQSLELLYYVSQQLSASDLTLDKLQDILREVEGDLALGHSQICISENGQLPAHTITTDLTKDELKQRCERMDCQHCFEQAELPLSEQAQRDHVQAVPIGDGDRFRGIFPVLLKDGTPLPREKERVLQTVGHHVSNALINMRRAEEKHRLAVLEERTVIARELHDSIAQSLSYLRIQVTRLEKCIDQGCDPRAIAEELKHGLAGAYRELRELITTFRLRIDERGFNVALQETVAEFSQKLGFPVALRNAMSGIVLSGNEEMHVIRIIREALSNIERHAEAKTASVAIAVDAFQAVTVRISDDGKGFDTALKPANHFGVNIMHDRSAILDGRLEVESAPGQGTTIILQFLPQKIRQAVPELS